jgi:hypothetical protein
MGYLVNPGTNENNAPNPIFNLTPSATVDEGNNWINMRWGPLALTHPVTGAILGNYGLASGSRAINFIPTNEALPIATPASLSSDFYGNPRPSGAGIDAGAVEFVQNPTGPDASVAPTTLTFGRTARGATSASQTLTLTNLGTGTLTGISLNFVSTNSVFSQSGGTCVAGGSLGPNATCTILVVFKPTVVGAVRGSLTITLNNGPNPGVVSGLPVTLNGTGF